MDTFLQSFQIYAEKRAGVKTSLLDKGRRVPRIPLKAYKISKGRLALLAALLGGGAGVGAAIAARGKKD